MARIVVGSYLIRYPVGGMMSWVFQYLAGFVDLGHEVYFVERADWENACFDPGRRSMSDDPSVGIESAVDLFQRIGISDQWCFVDYRGKSHGMPRNEMRKVLDGADVYIDMGVHGAWSEDAAGAARTVFIDGEPGFTQMKMVQNAGSALAIPTFDYYFTTGRNVGTPASSAPVAGRRWRPTFHPVVLDLFPWTRPNDDAPVTTVMNWQSYGPLDFEGRRYGHKDEEFPRFIDLPSRCSCPMELAVTGHAVPVEHLRANGWTVRDGLDVTATFDDFRRYIVASAAEFAVCKNGFVATNSGWFSDRSAAYLASGRPVVMQDTGFSMHLPTGCGLFATTSVDDAADALQQIAGDPVKHSVAAREIAAEYLNTRVVLRRLLEEVGV